MRHVIAAIEIIVDENFPVAVNVISGAVEEVQLADSEGRNALDQPSEELLQRRSLGVEIHEDETLPDFDAYRHQAVLSAVEVFYSLELRHALQRSIQRIIPTVVGTTNQARLPAEPGHDRAGVEPTPMA